MDGEQMKGEQMEEEQLKGEQMEEEQLKREQMEEEQLKGEQIEGGRVNTAKRLSKWASNVWVAACYGGWRVTSESYV